MRHYLESNILIAPTQYGFRQNHSAQSLLLQLSNKWLKILDNTSGDRYICLTALDVKKAFDTVDHHLLLSKMANYFKFHPSAIELMSSYLKACAQRFRYALFAFIHTQTYFEYYTLTLKFGEKSRHLCILDEGIIRHLPRKCFTYGDATLGC